MPISRKARRERRKARGPRPCGWKTDYHRRRRERDRAYYHPGIVDHASHLLYKHSAVSMFALVLVRWRGEVIRNPTPLLLIAKGWHDLLNTVLADAEHWHCACAKAERGVKD